MVVQLPAHSHSFVENNTLHIVTDYADQGDLNSKIIERVHVPSH